MSIVSSPPPDASATARGLVSTLAQTWAGVKTFASLIIASAGIQVASLFNTNGSSASDVGVKVGVTTPDASVNASAKLLSVRTGIGATEVERFYWTKDTMHLGGGGVWSALISSEIFWRTSGTSIFALLPSGIARSGYGFDVNPAFGANLSWQVQSSGLMNQSGTDRASTVGNDTQHKPSGINTIASGATSVVITNNLVPNPATAKVRLNLSWRGDPGSRWWWTQGTGTITINLQSAAPANVSFDWELAGLL